MGSWDAPDGSPMEINIEQLVVEWALDPRGGSKRQVDK